MLTLPQRLQKYDVPGPRYTSYPTVPAWSEGVLANDYQKALQKVSSHEPLSLYFHLPFCERLCHFCACFKVITKDRSRSAPYVEALVKEIDTVAQILVSPVGANPCVRPKVSQIHFGGGTPNFLQPDELSQIMKKIREHFEILSDAEIAIEMHPRTSTKEFCRQLAQEKFNRISLGVQDFDDEVQKLINRYQTYDQTRDMLFSLREMGFKHFNFDLIYGLPGQNEKKFQATLEKTLSLDPDRLAVYSYAHVPWKSKIQRAFADADLPSPETKWRLFEMAYEFFTQKGYELIGMDHFAKKNDELFQAQKRGGLHRNFMGYSTRADAHQIGFGVSSISYVAGNYFQNLKEIDVYQRDMAENKLATTRGFLLSNEDHIRRELITELMCHLRLDTPKFEKKFSLDFNNHFAKELGLLKGFEAEGLVKISDQSIQVLREGRLVVRNIAMCFDTYLDDIRKTATNPVFSRTV